MSDDDRLADYIRRIEGDTTPRTLPDGCACGESVLACNASRYLYSTRCCAECDHA